MAGSSFKHVGDVLAVETDGVVVVALNKLAACEGCKARGKCGNGASGESTTSVMRVVTQRADDFCVGDRVEVSITYRVGMIAVLFTYFVPLIVFLVVIISLLLCGVSEGLAAMMTFGVVAIYYIGIYLLRERFERVVQFDISKI